MLIITYLLSSLFGLHVLYSLMVFLRFPDRKNYERPQQSPRVSVIVCARNEAFNLRDNLPFLLYQDYPNFELIVVNDRSTDGTADVLEDFAAVHEQMRLVSVLVEPKKGSADPETLLKGKRNALKEGIEAATGDYVLLTDADCRPNSNQWMSKMVSCAQQESADIVLGVAPVYGDPPEGIVNEIIRYECLLTMANYVSFHAMNLPYMGVGRNLMYSRDAISSLNFHEINQTLSGDDDLAVSHLVKEFSSAVCLDDQAYVESWEAANFKDWKNRKLRHLQSGFHYPFKIKALLGFEHLISFTFYATIVFALLFGETRFVAAIAWLARGFVLDALLYPPMKAIKSVHLLKHLHYLDFFHSLVIPILGLLSKFQRKKDW